MTTWKTEIKVQDKHFRSLHSATVIFEADSFEDAEEQASAYADRLGMYDSADVDSLHEITPVQS